MAGCGLPRLAWACPQAPRAAAQLIGRYFPWLSGGALAGAAAVPYPGRSYLLTGLLLFLPLVDRYWRPPALPRTPPHYLSWAGITSIIAVLVGWQPSYYSVTVTALFLTALPEEWFFRAYLMVRLGNGFLANLAASTLFAFIHGLTRDWPTALLVFAPSLFYGWAYQRTHDLPLLILLHALSNLVFMLFLQPTVVIFVQGML